MGNYKVTICPLTGLSVADTIWTGLDAVEYKVVVNEILYSVELSHGQYEEISEAQTEDKHARNVKLLSDPQWALANHYKINHDNFVKLLNRSQS